MSNSAVGRIEYIVVQVLVAGLLLVALGSCASPAGTRTSGGLVGESEDPTDDELLYASVLDVFAEEGIDPHVTSEDRGVVMSDWERINEEVRHRWVARVIRANVGLVLKVYSVYERRDHSGAEPKWAKAEDEVTVKEAYREEQRLGAAIQRRFRALQRGHGTRR